MGLAFSEYYFQLYKWKKHSTCPFFQSGDTSSLTYPKELKEWYFISLFSGRIGRWDRFWAGSSRGIWSILQQSSTGLTQLVVPYEVPSCYVPSLYKAKFYLFTTGLNLSGTSSQESANWPFHWRLAQQKFSKSSDDLRQCMLRFLSHQRF